MNDNCECDAEKNVFEEQIHKNNGFDAAEDVLRSASKKVKEVVAPQRKVVTLERAVLSANDRMAAENRKYFAERGMLVLNLISSPGAGKTALLEKSLMLAQQRGIPTAVLVGDQYGEADAERLRNRGAVVTQIEVYESCHLTAAQINMHLKSSVPDETRLLIIENVGNLVCPVAFDLGEEMKIILLSTPEGEDKPLKYPGAFVAADLVLLTKVDLCEVLDYNLAQAVHNIRLVNPKAEIMQLSSRRGDGMEEWMEFITKRLNNN